MYIDMAPVYTEQSNEIYAKFALFKHSLIMNNLIDTELGDALEDLTQQYSDLVNELLWIVQKSEEERTRRVVKNFDNPHEKIARFKPKNLD